MGRVAVHLMTDIAARDTSGNPVDDCDHDNPAKGCQAKGYRVKDYHNDSRAV